MKNVVGANAPLRLARLGSRRSSNACRRYIVAFIACLLPGLTHTSHAIMAGAPPDTPAARVDPNTASSPYAGVGAVVSSGGGVTSGVVIARKYVLTARHVVAPNLKFQLNPGPTPWITHVASAVLEPGGADIAVLQLADPVPAGTPIYPMYHGGSNNDLTVTLVGYGGSGNGDVGVTVGASAAVKRVGRNVVTVKEPHRFIYDFDGPSGLGDDGLPSLGNAVETNVATGDSGSPAFVAEGSVLRVFGINTQNSGVTFGSVGVGVVASDPQFANWLLAATAGTMVSRRRDADPSKLRLDDVERFRCLTALSTLPQ